MKTFSALLAFCAGNPGEFPTQRPVTRSFDVFFDLRLNKQLSKQSWGWWFETPSCPLWRHRNVSSSMLKWNMNHYQYKSVCCTESNRYALNYSLSYRAFQRDVKRIGGYSNYTFTVTLEHLIAFCAQLTILLCIWYIRPSLVHIRAYRLLGPKPLSEPMLACWQLDILWEHISVKFELEYNHFHLRKCIWKCRRRNCGHFVVVSLG